MSEILDGDLVPDYLAETRDLVARIDAPEVEAFVDVLFEAWRAERTVFVFGNGGSASTAQHLAADLFCCCAGPDDPPVRALCLNDNMPLVSALTNDAGWDAVYLEQLRTWFEPGDVAIGISVHGGTGSDRAGPWSQNVVAALRYTSERGGAALGIVGFDGGVMREVCAASILVPARSTPHTEGLHVVVHHLVTTALRDRIERHRGGAS